MKKIALSILVSLALSPMVFASPNTNTGCGLGSQVIRDDSNALMLALQATFNGTSGNQTFGVTFGTSGCKKTKLVLSEKVNTFVASNMDQLSKEVAMGRGESVDTLAELMNISDKKTFISSLQANYNKIYTSSKVEMADVVDNINAI